MKVLIVSHSHISAYGAITSLRYLTNNIDWEYDLVYPKHYRENASDQIIRDFFGGRLGVIYRAYLPYMVSFIVKNPPLIRKVKDFLTRRMAALDAPALYRFIDRGNYDYIILNSIILFPMIRTDGRYILYVREKYTGRAAFQKKMIKKINQADKVIFIDPALVGSVPGIRAPYRVINNPFDMSSMSRIDVEETARKYPEIDRNRVTIVIAGVITERKGVLFAIRAFRKVQRQDLQFVIVGNGDVGFVSKCKEEAGESSDVVFLGEQNNMQEIYLLTDYLLRADMFFATGRTVYEALYAGCNVILQTDTEKDPEMIHEYDIYRERFCFYHTRDEESLKKVFEKLPREKVKERSFRSNLDQYIAEIKDFLTEDPS